MYFWYSGNSRQISSSLDFYDLSDDKQYVDLYCFYIDLEEYSYLDASTIVFESSWFSSWSSLFSYKYNQISYEAFESDNPFSQSYFCRERIVDRSIQIYCLRQQQQWVFCGCQMEWLVGGEFDIDFMSLLQMQIEIVAAYINAMKAYIDTMNLEKYINIQMLGNNLKKLDFEAMERPKTLIIIHYKGKRLSIPLLESPDNLTDFLYSQLLKFQSEVLHKDKNQPQTNNKIVCFTAKKQGNNQSDIRMSIILSMIRLTGKSFKAAEQVEKMDIKRIDICLDITKYYKLMEVEPYYSRKVQQLFPTYQIFSILETNANFTTYLGRRKADGRFFSAKVYLADNPLGIKEYNVMKLLSEEQSSLNNIQQLQGFPQVQEIKKSENSIILIYEFFVGGKANQYFRVSSHKYKTLNELECLDYMKQLIWTINSLHDKYNLIHREVCLENLQLDFYGNLRLVNYSNCILCYSSNYLINTQVAQTYEGTYSMPNNIVPPEVIRSARYNNLVDYYGIGTILYQLYYGQSPSMNSFKKKGDGRTGIQVAIQNLMNQNIEDRQLFINEILSQLHEQKIQNIQNKSQDNRGLRMNKQPLPLGKIVTGQLLRNTQNGINFEMIMKELGGNQQKDPDYSPLNPMKKTKSKSKNKSKSRKKTHSKDSKDSTKKPNSSSSTKPHNLISTKPHKNINFDTRSKKSDKSQDKSSLNGSLDSKNHSVKSKKSRSSQSKTKNQKIENTGKKGVSSKTIKSPIKIEKTNLNLPPKSLKPQPNHKYGGRGSSLTKMTTKSSGVTHTTACQPRY